MESVDKQILWTLKEHIRREDWMTIKVILEYTLNNRP